MSLIPGCFSCLWNSLRQVFLPENGANTDHTEFIAKKKSTSSTENTLGQVNKCPLTVSLTVISLLFIQKISADEGKGIEYLNT